MHTFSYEVGDVVGYEPFGGGIRRVLVLEKDPDIKNGRPGFVGVTTGPEIMDVWGYDSQIEFVNVTQEELF